MLSEIASKALSPGINDPGTALDILVRATRLLRGLGAARAAAAETNRAYDRIHAPEVATGDLFDDAFDAIERDGAGSRRSRVATAIGARDPGGQSVIPTRRRRRVAIPGAPWRGRAPGLSHADDLARVEAAAIAAQGETA